jgi:hypothetical protein
MKKTIVFTALFICTTFGPVFAGEVIKGFLPEKLYLLKKLGHIAVPPHPNPLPLGGEGRVRGTLPQVIEKLHLL